MPANEQPDEGDEPAWATPEVLAVRADLTALVERIDELALDLLRAAVDAGELERPEAERRLVRVRNALERSLHLLGG
ncbi:MAG: hypothetical protein JWM85_1846 [Acidimicrobiaceae bacterium]|nr:hypothetical protein [Acidimicrobiaceae bacterium]